MFSLWFFPNKWDGFKACYICLKTIITTDSIGIYAGYSEWRRVGEYSEPIPNT